MRLKLYKCSVIKHTASLGTAILNSRNKSNDHVKWYMKCFIYWTVDFKSSQIWSSQLWTQFKQLRKPEKVRTSTGSRVHPVEVLTFSGFRNCLDCVHNCDDHSWLEVMTIAVTEPAFTRQCHLMTMTMLMTIILAMNFCDEVSPNKGRRGRWGKNVYKKSI